LKIIKVDDTMIFHMYTWVEAVSQTEIVAGHNVCKERLSMDVLLPGRTAMWQVECSLDDDCKKLTLSYTPPATYLSADRAVVRVADIQGIDAANLGAAMEPMRATACVTGHEVALNTIRPLQMAIKTIIDLPFAVDTQFCSHDDYGRPGHADGISIGVYRHDDPDYQRNNQFVWILHVEMTNRAGEKATPAKAAVLKFYGAVV
jgi:hypothetical protein